MWSDPIVSPLRWSQVFRIRPVTGEYYHPIILITRMRSCIYMLARNAAYRYRHNPHQRHIHLSSISSNKSRFAQAVTPLRVATKMHLRTETKSRVRDLYRILPDEDQSLINLLQCHVFHLLLVDTNPRSSTCAASLQHTQPFKLQQLLLSQRRAEIRVAAANKLHGPIFQPSRKEGSPKRSSEN